MKLRRSFYLNDDVVAVSRELLGKALCTRIDGVCTEVLITETEAYAGETDKASHAFGGRRTPRTEPMYGQGGIAYVYLCYGIHHLFNVVTNVDGTPHAVLIRAATPLLGISRMLSRRNKKTQDRSLLSGPGCVAQALGIDTGMTGTDLEGDAIWIEDRGIDVSPDDISIGPRIGVDYAAEDADRPYRFRLQNIR